MCLVVIFCLFHGYRRFAPKALAQLFQDAGLRVERMWSLGGAPTFLFHAFWITFLETILLGKVLRVRASLRRGLAGTVYSLILRLALRLDPLFPVLPVGYAVLIRKPS